jgi:hypothetical protein
VFGHGFARAEDTLTKKRGGAPSVQEDHEKTTGDTPTPSSSGAGRQRQRHSKHGDAALRRILNLIPNELRVDLDSRSGKMKVTFLISKRQG